MMLQILLTRQRPALPTAKVNDWLPGPGLEIEIALDFKIPWVREVLMAAGTTVGDLSNKGKCRAGPMKYYEARSVMTRGGGLRASALKRPHNIPPRHYL